MDEESSDEETKRPFATLRHSPRSAKIIKKKEEDVVVPAKKIEDEEEEEKTVTKS